MVYGSDIVRSERALSTNMRSSECLGSVHCGFLLAEVRELLWSFMRDVSALASDAVYDFLSQGEYGKDDGHVVAVRGKTTIGGGICVALVPEGRFGYEVPT